jgi:uncharacterized RDD family membrane protein YckC
MVLGEHRPAIGTAAVRPRLLASLADLAMIGSWLGVLTAVGAVVRRFVPDRPPAVPSGRARLAADVGIFAATVLPTGLYLGLTEAGPAQASLGKRWLGLRVVDRRGGRPGRAQIARRTAVKLLPWQLAHLSVARMMWRDQRSRLTWPAYVASLVVPLVSVVLALRDPAGRALHDRAAGTRVVSSMSSDLR